MRAPPRKMQRETLHPMPCRKLLHRREISKAPAAADRQQNCNWQQFRQ